MGQARLFKFSVRTLIGGGHNYRDCKGDLHCLSEFFALLLANKKKPTRPRPRARPMRMGNPRRACRNVRARFAGNDQSKANRCCPTCRKEPKASILLHQKGEMMSDVIGSLQRG